MKPLLRSLASVLASILFIVPLPARSSSLDGKWKLDYWEQGRVPVVSPEGMAGIDFKTVEATVPGNVELDLLRAGLIEDPQTDSNVYLLEPWESFQWRYSRVFPTPATEEGGSAELRFEGIDCFADIWLNGHHAGSTDNMLVSHAFDVTELLRPEGQENRLEVYLRSSVLEGRKQITPSLSRNSPSPESIYVRRAPHTYGWDIMPRLVSAGLWRSVVLEVHPKAWIRDTYWYVESLRPEHARIYLDYTLALPPDFCTGSLKAAWRISRDGKTAAEGETTPDAHAGRIQITVPEPELWWPRGYGEHPLYDVEFQLQDAGGRLGHAMQASGHTDRGPRPQRNPYDGAARALPFLCQRRAHLHQRQQLDAHGRLPQPGSRASGGRFRHRAGSQLQHAPLLGRECL